MASAPPFSHRCEPRDIPTLLTPGFVTGFFSGNQWIDWTGEAAQNLEIITPGRKAQLSRNHQDRYHVLLDGHVPAPITSAFIECLVGRSRGVAVVSSRLGCLLRWAPRLVAPPIYPQRSSGPFRFRASGGILPLRETVLRVVERAQVLDSATLSVAVADPFRAAGLLHLSFPDLQVDRLSLHLSLRGHHPEEILGRLRIEGIPVTGSSVWYRALQPGPPAGVLPVPHLPSSPGRE